MSTLFDDIYGKTTSKEETNTFDDIYKSSKKEAPVAVKEPEKKEQLKPSAGGFDDIYGEPKGKGAQVWDVAKKVAKVEEAWDVTKKVGKAAWTPTEKILRELSRPGYAVTSGIYDAKFGEGAPEYPKYLPKEQAILPRLPESLQRLIGGAGRGFQLKDPKAGYDILKKMSEKGEVKSLPRSEPYNKILEKMSQPEYKPTEEELAFVATQEKLNNYHPLKTEWGQRIGGFSIDVQADPLLWFSGAIKTGMGGISKAFNEKVLPKVVESSLGRTVGGMFKKDFAMRVKYPELAAKAD